MFGVTSNFQEEDFIVTEANKIIYEFIKLWPNWGEHRFANICYIKGEVGSGKTHIASIWQRMTYAKFLSKQDFISGEVKEIVYSRQNLIIDDIEDFLDYEDELFHLINQVVESRKFLLITSIFSINKLNLSLLDLQSRLNACNYFEIEKPDLELLKAILMKQLSDRQLKINLDVINYILSRVGRSYSELAKYIDYIDKESLVHKKNITIPFIKKGF